MVTVAVRRVNVTDKKKPMLTDYLDPKKYLFTEYSTSCFNSHDALKNSEISARNGRLETS